MIGSILSAGAPVMAAFAVSAASLILLIRLSRLQWSWSRLRRIRRDEQGGVQSLAFVLTFPLFLLLVLFIVQLSQLMIGVVVVHYAAFASARAASVWIPAETEDSFRTAGGDVTGQNELPPFIAPGQPWTLSQDVVDGLGSRKCREIWTAAALACVPLAPSGQKAAGGSSLTVGGIASSLATIVQSLDPNAAKNARMPRRIANKVAYSFANTTVDLQLEDRSSQSPGGDATYNPIGHPRVASLPSEVGWRDPVTVTVHHKFVLLPGPGHWLAAGIANRDGRIVQEGGVYKTTLTASATMTIEGLQSLRPTLHAPQ